MYKHYIFDYIQVQAPLSGPSCWISYPQITSLLGSTSLKEYVFLHVRENMQYLPLGIWVLKLHVNPQFLSFAYKWYLFMHLYICRIFHLHMHQIFIINFSVDGQQLPKDF